MKDVYEVVLIINVVNVFGFTYFILLVLMFCLNVFICILFACLVPVEVIKGYRIPWK